MPKLILARHGNTFESGQTPTQVGAKSDLPLTAQGLKQAEALKFINPQAVYAGSLKRQIQSAMVVADAFIYEPALTEIDYGLWEGLTTEEIKARWSKEYEEWTQGGRWPENIFGGSLQSHLEAIDRWLDHLRATYKSGDTILAFSSNGIIRLFHPAPPANREEIKVKTGHFCIFELLPKSLEVFSWNVNPL